MSDSRGMKPPVIETLAALFSVVVLCWSMATHPTQRRCPDGWWLPEGVRRSGAFVCRPSPIGGDDDVLTGKSTGVQPPGAIRGRVYCTGGSVPIVRYDGLTVGCSR